MSGNDAMAGRNPTERFSDRVENYVKYRPRYPREVLALLAREVGLDPKHEIADLGSGTGILTELFLSNGNSVHAVEPNAGMREAAEQEFSGNPRFHSVSATAEATMLPPASVDFVTAGQAFHWFDPLPTKREIQRILKPGGSAIMLWNDRLETDSIGREYDELLVTFGIDYAKDTTKYRFGEAQAREFFAPAAMSVRSIPNNQRLTLEALLGRLLSASYAPNVGHPRHEPMLRACRALFDRHEQNGSIALQYQTRIFFGTLA